MLKAFKSLPAPLFRHGLLLSFLCGSAASLAMAPYNVWLTLLVSLSLFYWLLHNAGSARSAAAYGYAYGFGYFFFSLIWVGNALLVEGNPYTWVWPLAVVGLPLILAPFMAITAYVTRKFADTAAISGFLFFCAVTAFLEWLRSFIFTGFPWNLFAYTWIEVLPVAQIAALTDIFVLNLLTLLWMTMPGFLLVSTSSARHKKNFSACLLFLFFAAHVFGSWRLTQNPVSTHSDTFVHLVQPNIPQAEKWDRDKIWSHFGTHLALSQSSGAQAAHTIIVWPETAISHWLTRDPLTMHRIQEALNSYNGEAILLTGLLRHEAETQSFYNSLALINQSGELAHVYDKHHLVPFGEYIPYQKWIPLKPIVEFSGFKPGNDIVTVPTASGLSYSPAICYEIIFPGQIVDRDKRPDFIVNVTNDAWYGQSAGPYQHFVQARFRAIEEGLPVVRVANTGISGVIDPLGRIAESSKLMEQYEKTIALPRTNVFILPKRRIHEIALFLCLVLPPVLWAFIKKSNLNKKI